MTTQIVVPVSAGNTYTYYAYSYQDTGYSTPAAEIFFPYMTGVFYST